MMTEGWRKDGEGNLSSLDGRWTIVESGPEGWTVIDNFRPNVEPEEPSLRAALLRVELLERRRRSEEWL